MLLYLLVDPWVRDSYEYTYINIGEELAVVSKNEKSLVNAYQNVLYGYSASWLDFYLSGNGLNNKTVVDLRNLALRTMQISDPNPRISYTLPGTPSGFSESALYVLQSAVNLGVRVDGNFKFK